MCPTDGETPAPQAWSSPGLTLLDTPLGRCAVAWSGRGIAALQLPEATESETCARALRRLPEAREAPPPPAVRQAIAAIAALLRGEAADLSTVALDLDGVPPFHRRVYAAARAIPPGTTLTYGEVAARLGAPGSARAVGQALGRNPFAIIVPCHRVVAAGGRDGGFSAHGGVATKRRLLALEGAAAPEGVPGRDGAPSPDPTEAFAGTPVSGGVPAPDGPPSTGTAPGSAGTAPTGVPGVPETDGWPGIDGPAALRHLRAADPALGGLIDAVGPCRLRVESASSTFAALTEAIVYQQLTPKAAGTIFARVCAIFPPGRDAPTPEQILSVPDEALRAAGLSAAKAFALRDLARRAAGGELPTPAEAGGLAEEELLARLTAVRGIGRWTAQMFLIFRLGRPDVLPADDYGLRRGFAAAFGLPALPEPREVQARGEAWRPYRSVASWYLWRAAERAKG